MVKDYGTSNEAGFGSSADHEVNEESTTIITDKNRHFYPARNTMSMSGELNLNNY